MTSCGKYLLAFALLVFTAAATRAALDVGAAPNTSRLQLIVMEAPGCTYCKVFRRDILPSFATSERGKALPVRFLDVNDLERANLTLDSSVDMVPTFVLVQDRREVGRIAGYVGPAAFFQSIGHLLSTLP